jgi:hypothetical protein
MLAFSSVVPCLSDVIEGVAIPYYVVKEVKLGFSACK